MPSPERDALSNRAEAVQSSAVELASRVDALAASNVRLARRGFWNRVLIVITIIGLVLDLALSGLFIVEHIGQVRNNHKIECQNALRAAGAKIADADRANVTALILAVSSGRVTTRAQYAKVFDHYKAVAHADNVARARIGQANAGTCS